MDLLVVKMKISSAPADLKDSGLMVSVLSLLNSPVWCLQKPDAVM